MASLEAKIEIAMQLLNRLNGGEVKAILVIGGGRTDLRPDKLELKNLAVTLLENERKNSKQIIKTEVFVKGFEPPQISRGKGKVKRW